jgi:hypothetical protein
MITHWTVPPVSGANAMQATKQLVKKIIQIHNKVIISDSKVIFCIQ